MLSNCGRNPGDIEYDRMGQDRDVTLILPSLDSVEDTSHCSKTTSVYTTSVSVSVLVRIHADTGLPKLALPQHRKLNNGHNIRCFVTDVHIHSLYINILFV